MIDYQLDQTNNILEVHPNGRLQAEDFITLASVADPVIETKGPLAGILIETESFPGWDSLAALVEHFKFIKNHHQHVKKIALVTNSKIAVVAEKLANHFVAAEIQQFDAGMVDEARGWITKNVTNPN